MPPLSRAQHSLGLHQEVIVKAPCDRTNIVLKGGLELLLTGSIYRWYGTENRKGTISFSPDTQNATSVGGHRLQTEISEPVCSPGREGVGEWGVTREAG